VRRFLPAAGPVRPGPETGPLADPTPEPPSMRHPQPPRPTRLSCPIGRAFVVAFVLLLSTGPEPLHAQTVAPPPPVSDDLEVWLLTIDRGEEIWEMFGHNAILIRDPATLDELAWNWGLFNFEDVDFIPRFLRGTMRYTMGPIEADHLLESYAAADRTIYANRVNLTPEQARELDAFVRWNFQPENRAYIYDYFRDNCSTRVRDALDLVLDGAIRSRFGELDTPRTWRWQARRMVQTVTWVDQGLSFLLGLRGDRAITAWEAMFLPVELMNYLESMQVAGPEGTMRPLLGPREVIYQSRGTPTPAAAPGFSPVWLLLGLAVGALLLAAGAGSGGSERIRRLAPTLGGAAWGIFTGLLGLILVSAWFTDHVFIHLNMNLVQANPLGLVLAAFLIRLVLRPEGWKGTPGRAAVGLAIAVAGLAVLGALLQLVPALRQGNAEVLAVTLPIHLSLAASLFAVRSTLTSGGRHP